METKKVCLECGDSIVGRSDKRFCSDQCRNSYNNKLNSDANSYVRNVSNILRKNRRILQELNPGGKVKVHRDKMIEKGFNLSYHTHTYTTQKGDTYVYCFEYGYLALSDNMYFLVKDIKADL